VATAGHLLLLLGCAVVIYLACEWFVNAVEWLGIRLQMGTLAVGTVLAAIGTALPESVVTLVAVTLGGTAGSKQIGIGAAMGGPLVLATIAYGVTGWMLLRHRTPGGPNPLRSIDRLRLVSDQTWFAAYGAYFRREMRADTEAHTDADLEPLKLQPHRAAPAGWAVAVQSVLTLAVIFGASQVFVGQLEWAGPALGLPAAVTALLLSPIATELPEVMNAVIWVRQGKTQLALANISGAMMIQATVPSGLGLLFTPWLFNAPLVLSGVVTMAAIVYLRWLGRTNRLTPGRLAFAAVFYGVFAAGLVFLGI
jgi:cation:H+ antiporter